jgi:hypothetical protein
MVIFSKFIRFDAILHAVSLRKPQITSGKIGLVCMRMFTTLMPFFVHPTNYANLPNAMLPNEELQNNKMIMPPPPNQSHITSSHTSR